MKKWVCTGKNGIHGGYWWYQAPIESQAMMIEAFTEIEKDPQNN